MTAMPQGNVISMPNTDAPTAPWAFLGFNTERDMLLDDLKALNTRLKAADTPAHAIAALSKRKTEVLDQIKHLDLGDDDEDILDDSEDEAFTTGA